LTPWIADLSQIFVVQQGILGWSLDNAFVKYFFPSLWKVVMKIPGSQPAYGMWYSRNVSGALVTVWLWLGLFNFVLPRPPCFSWLIRLT
jgi:hypothetical protein